MSANRLHPAYVTDAHLIELRTAELFEVTEMRLWAAPYRNPAGNHPGWEHGFAAARVDGGGGVGFDTLFRIIVAAHSRSLDVRCQRCGPAWAGRGAAAAARRPAATDDVDDALAVLWEWLPPAAVHMALLPAQRFVAALAEAGLRIPDYRPDAAGSIARAVAHGDRGLALVH
ncbi:MAG: hypothetical protein JWL84_5977 [Rhodospirillales bacterium]|jgi:hypothetical protein|nr:hypothetical protein [Rhodospirillales bacterium]